MASGAGAAAPAAWPGVEEAFPVTDSELSSADDEDAWDAAAQREEQQQLQQQRAQCQHARQQLLQQEAPEQEQAEQQQEGRQHRMAAWQAELQAARQRLAAAGQLPVQVAAQGQQQRHQAASAQQQQQQAAGAAPPQQWPAKAERRRLERQLGSLEKAGACVDGLKRARSAGRSAALEAAGEAEAQGPADMETDTHLLYTVQDRGGWLQVHALPGKVGKSPDAAQHAAALPEVLLLPLDAPGRARQAQHGPLPLQAALPQQPALAQAGSSGAGSWEESAGLGAQDTPEQGLQRGSPAASSDGRTERYFTAAADGSGGAGAAAQPHAAGAGHLRPPFVGNLIFRTGAGYTPGFWRRNCIKL